MTPITRETVDAINEQLATLSAQIFPSNMRLYYAHVDELIEQDLNAQSMPKAMFDQLVANIKAAHAPETLPLIAQTQKGKEIVSGHHRTRASRAAGQMYVLTIMYLDLPRDRILSKQLAHNSIHGTSDAQIVAQIWSQIQDVQARFESFIDPRDFGSVQPVSFRPVDVDVQNAVKSVLLMFLPTQQMDYDAALEAVLPKTSVDKVYIASRESFDAWKAALQRVRADLDIVHAPTAVAVMAQLAMERLDQLAAENAAQAG